VNETDRVSRTRVSVEVVTEGDVDDARARHLVRGNGSRDRIGVHERTRPRLSVEENLDLVVLRHRDPGVHGEREPR
jgi:hypothetical protein